MKFLRRTLLGGIIIYVFALMIDIFISKSLLRSSLFTDELKVWNVILDDKIKNDEVLFFGSSRSLVHINPKIVKKEINVDSYNFGYNGQRLPLIKYRIDNCLKKDSIKNIVLILDDFSFQDDYIFKVDHLSPLLLYNKELYDIQGNVGYYSLIDVYVPLIRYLKNNEDFNWLHEVYKVYAYSKVREYRIRGYRKNDVRFKESTHSKSKTIIEVNNNVFKKLDDLVNLSKKDDFNLIFVTSPTYIDELNRYSNHKEIINKISNFSKDNNIIFFDYSEMKGFNNKKYFADSNHLNSQGADIFTKKLVEDIKPYLK
ncbi:hypothetical protein HX096_01670 [Empedobacter falsenii]|uniref:hypothetical protein n=1 Tax=Empedobacter falsenii TaxID=343874 RepID=UPI002576948D|nr:hypothetical protein [Empedobacter falsenii]MDM1546567.1 hypothetical protein [Empedobacter falsenii]